MIRVAHVLQCMAERSGGPLQVARGLGDAVASQGHTVCYRSPASKEDMPQLASCGPNVRLYPMDRPHAWFRSKALAKALTNEIRSLDAVHLHEVWSHPVFAAAKIARNAGTPYLITPHGELESRHLRHKSLAKYFKKTAYLTLLGRPMLRGASCLHAITPYEIEGFRQAGYDGSVAVVPNGIAVDQFANLPDPAEAENLWPRLHNRRVVLFLSRLSPEKGLDQLIPAWKNLTNQGSYDDAVLVIAGPDDRGYDAVVKGLVERHGVGSRVLMTGMVQGREKMALISRADIYTLPSYSEGFSMSVLENLAAAKPVLITPGCNFPEVAEAGAGLSVPPESKELEVALRQLLDMSDADRAAMGSRGRDLVHHNYTWEIAARKMITVYRCILEGKEIPLHPEPAKTSRAAA